MRPIWLLSSLALFSLVFFGWSSARGQGPGEEPLYKFCRINGTCAAMEQNTDCSDPLLNFCTNCSGASSVMKKCKGSGALSPCQDEMPPDMCGQELIAFCSVDNCSSYSPSGGQCSGTDCLQ
jgi:hypothetical protein